MGGVSWKQLPRPLIAKERPKGFPSVTHQDRRFTLNLVMTKLPTTSISSIAITFLVVNLSKLLGQFLSLFLSFLILTRTHELNRQGYLKKNLCYKQFKNSKADLLNKLIFVNFFGYFFSKSYLNPVQFENWSLVSK